MAKETKPKWVMGAELATKIGLSEEYLHRLANELKIPFLMDRASTRMFNIDQVQKELELLAIQKVTQQLNGFGTPCPENVKLTHSFG